MLPKDFTDYTSTLFGKERWEQYLASFESNVPVSVRYNPFKKREDDESLAISEPLPWCRNAFYLSERPDFTLDPLLHAGVYYVQEAGSMFLDEVIRQLAPDYLPEKGMALDLCAAPGGKSTLLRAALPEGYMLYSNEPDRRRANILMENIQKQGHPKVVVTNNYAIDYQRSGMQFDFILCDVPCSGEGMFRKDSGAIGEWSLQNVMKCTALQRSIIEDIWPCLTPNGILVYSTCTFNTHEDEENVRWICETFGAELLPIKIEDEWNITGSLLPEWQQQPVYRFIPGVTRGEGLFMAVLRKNGDDVVKSKPKGCLRIMCDGHYEAVQRTRPNAKAEQRKEKYSSSKEKNGNAKEKTGNAKGNKAPQLVPAHAEALLITTPEDKYPRAELTLEDALRYLHHEAIVLDSSVPRGYVVVCYHGHPLGFVKNIGNRANNLYPQEWKIRKDLG